MPETSCIFPLPNELHRPDMIGEFLVRVPQARRGGSLREVGHASDHIFQHLLLAKRLTERSSTHNPGHLWEMLQGIFRGRSNKSELKLEGQLRESHTAIKMGLA